MNTQQLFINRAGAVRYLVSWFTFFLSPSVGFVFVGTTQSPVAVVFGVIAAVSAWSLQLQAKQIVRRDAQPGSIGQRFTGQFRVWNMHQRIMGRDGFREAIHAAGLDERKWITYRKLCLVISVAAGIFMIVALSISR